MDAKYKTVFKPGKAVAWLKAVVLYWGPNIQLVLRINRSGLLRLGTRFVSVEEAQAQRRKSSKGLRTDKGDDMENRTARSQHEWKLLEGDLQHLSLICIAGRLPLWPHILEAKPCQYESLRVMQ
jgi:hypothetical protein